MKCEWKDGKLNSCRDMSEELILIQVKGDTGISYCPFCGANIRKPKPLEPIIIKSGETWVASFEGVDYLNVAQFNEYADTEKVKCDFNDHKLNPRYWKPFSEIEITDEIAKLRPMVKSNWLNKGTIHKLYGIDEDKSDIILSGNTAYIENYVLATVKDLEE